MQIDQSEEISQSQESHIQEIINYCDQCEEQKSKYKCPQCKKRHCSIVCINLHKKQDGCKGIKKVNHFISKSVFGEKDLMNDLRFLQNQMNNTEKIKKKLSLIKVKTGDKNMRAKLLKENSYKKHKIDLQILPFIYQRHRDNLSFYFTKDKNIYWSVELLFFTIQDIFSVITQPISELSNLEQVVTQQQKQLNPYLGIIIIIVKYHIDISNPEQMLKLIKQNQLHIFIQITYKSEVQNKLPEQNSLEDQFNKFNQQLLEEEQNQIQDQDFQENQIQNMNFQQQQQSYKNNLQRIKIEWNQSLESLLKNSMFIEMPTFIIVRNEDLSYYQQQIENQQM